jgi:hypothetical protein
VAAVACGDPGLDRKRQIVTRGLKLGVEAQGLPEAAFGLAKLAQGEVAKPLAAQACEMVRVSVDGGLAIDDRSPVVTV